MTETEKPDETIEDDAPGVEEPGETPGDDGDDAADEGGEAAAAEEPAAP